MSIQNTLKSFLQERNLTQAQFAELAGLNPCGLSKFLNREGGESIAERVYPYLHESKALIVPPTDSTDPEKEDGSMSASQQDSSSLSHGGDCQQREQSSSNPSTL